MEGVAVNISPLQATKLADAQSRIEDEAKSTPGGGCREKREQLTLLAYGNVTEQTTADLELISSEAKRLADMSSGVLQAFSDEETDVGMFPFSIETVLQQVGRLVMPMLSKNRNTLALDIAKDLPLVHGRAGECTQLVWNLLANAAAHTKDGEITINAQRAADSFITVTVTDNGEGISPELLSHVFERRYAGTQEGAGLGLSICKEIVEAHGGSITMESSIDKGVTVSFTLPCTGGEEKE